jgi:hypothetical protein
LSDLVRGYALQHSLLQSELLAELPDPAGHRTKFPTAKDVLVYLAWAASERTHVARTSLSWLSEVSLWNRDTVKHAVEYLVTIGEVEVAWGGRGQGSRSTFRFPRFQLWLAERDATGNQGHEMLPSQQLSAATSVDHAERSDTRNATGQHFPAPPEMLTKRERNATPSSIPRAPYKERAPVRGNPSLVTGSTSLPRESKPRQRDGKEQEGKKGTQTGGAARRPRTPRPPDDPDVLATVEAIRADGGRGASARAAKYLRRVSEEWGRHQAALAITNELGKGIGDMPS